MTNEQLLVRLIAAVDKNTEALSSAAAALQQSVEQHMELNKLIREMLARA